MARRVGRAPRGRYIADGYVDPELRERAVGSALISLTETRARELGAPAGDKCVYLHNATIERDAAPLFEAAGYVPSRHFWRLVADLDTAPLFAVPEDVVIRNYREPDERRGVYETLEAAFANHWEHQPRSYEEWAKRHFEREGFDPSLLWVAEAGGAIAGAIDADGSHHAGDWGFIPAVGVLRAHGRRGIAEALLLTAFAEFYRRGETRLYEKVGIRVFWEAIVYEKELQP